MCYYSPTEGGSTETPETGQELGDFPGGTVVKNLPANEGDIGNEGSIPESERSLGVENGNPFQYSCLENFVERGAWQATVHGAAKSQTRLSD